MAYETRFRLQGAPQGCNDGSAQVAHDVVVVYREVGDTMSWKLAPSIPAHHQTILVPADELGAVLDMGSGAAKVNAYKQLLADHRTDGAQPLNTNWQEAAMIQFLENNDASTEERDRADAWILSVAGSYPVPFSV